MADGKVRRTADRDICYMDADPVQLWTLGIVEWRIYTGHCKFIATPIMRDRSEGPPADLTEAFEQYLWERG
jgi:hypothetical protein